MSDVFQNVPGSQYKRAMAICQVVEVRIIAGRLPKYPRNHQTIFGMAITLGGNR